MRLQDEVNDYNRLGCEKGGVVGDSEITEDHYLKLHFTQRIIFAGR